MKFLPEPMTPEEERAFRHRYGKRAMLYRTSHWVPKALFLAYVVALHRPKGRLRSVGHYVNDDDYLAQRLPAGTVTGAVFYDKSYPVTQEAERLPIVEV